MKKLILLFVMVASALLATVTKTYALDLAREPGEIEDKYLKIDYKKNDNKITIELSDKTYEMTTAVVEQAYLENGNKISILKDYKISDNTFALDDNVVAFDIWQLLVTKDDETFRFMTTGNTTWNDLSDVIERRGFTSIKTVGVKRQTTHMWINSPVNNSSNNKLSYFEYYFKFDDAHDHVLNIDVEYNLITGVGLGEKRTRINEKVIPDGVEIEGFLDSPGLDIEYTDKIVVRGLDRSFNTSYEANYVARVFPLKLIDSRYRITDYNVENYAIVNIEYIHNGEFFSKRVINPPVTNPDSPDINLDWLQRIINWISENLSLLGKIITGIVIALVAIPAFAILGLVFKLIKMIFSAIKFLIVPKKKNKK